MCRIMDKIEIANNLVRLFADYKKLIEDTAYKINIKDECSEAVANAILLLNQNTDGGENSVIH